MSTVSDRVLILGVGSPFGADRAGWHAIELLRGAGLQGVRLATTDRPGARLLGLFEGVQRAILIDALVCDAAPGSLHRLDPVQLAAGDRGSNHGFGVADALALGKALGMLPPRLGIIGVSASGDRPPAIDRAELVGMVRTMLREKAMLCS